MHELSNKMPKKAKNAKKNSSNELKMRFKLLNFKFIFTKKFCLFYIISTQTIYIIIIIKMFFHQGAHSQIVIFSEALKYEQ